MNSIPPSYEPFGYDARRFRRTRVEAGGERALCLAFHNFEKPDDTVSTAEKNALTFEVLSDIG
jgi:hypothetical protein